MSDDLVSSLKAAADEGKHELNPWPPGIAHEFDCTHEKRLCDCYGHALQRLRAEVEALRAERDRLQATAFALTKEIHVRADEDVEVRRAWRERLARQTEALEALLDWIEHDDDCPSHSGKKCDCGVARLQRLAALALVEKAQGQPEEASDR